MVEYASLEGMVPIAASKAPWLLLIAVLLLALWFSARAMGGRRGTLWGLWRGLLRLGPWWSVVALLLFAGVAIVGVRTQPLSDLNWSFALGCHGGAAADPHRLRPRTGTNDEYSALIGTESGDRTEQARELVELCAHSYDFVAGTGFAGAFYLMRFLQHTPAAARALVLERGSRDTKACEQLPIDALRASILFT